MSLKECLPRGKCVNSVWSASHVTTQPSEASGCVLFHAHSRTLQPVKCNKHKSGQINFSNNYQAKCLCRNILSSRKVFYIEVKRLMEIKQHKHRHRGQLWHITAHCRSAGGLGRLCVVWGPGWRKSRDPHLFPSPTLTPPGFFSFFFFPSSPPKVKLPSGDRTDGSFCSINLMTMPRD